MKLGIFMTSIYWDRKQKIAKELKIARIRKDLTQAKLATLLKKSASFVNKYETAERRLDVAEFSIICETLGVKEQDIIDSCK